MPRASLTLTQVPSPYHGPTKTERDCAGIGCATTVEKSGVNCEKTYTPAAMKIQRALTLSSLIWSWVYGVVCGLGIASTVVGLLRGEALPGAIWPALIPLLLGSVLILRVVGGSEKRLA